MRTVNFLTTVCVLGAIPTGIIAWLTLNLRLMGVALGLAMLAAGLGMWVRRVETRA